MSNMSNYTVPINGTATTFEIEDESGRAQLSDIQAYIGYATSDILGLHVDYKNKIFERLGGARGKVAGADFDQFSMYGGRKLCNLADDGTVNAWYGDNNYVEDGSNGQVMVYQPKFYYKVVPLQLEPIGTGIGYHLRDVNYYISATKYPGFKTHPAFFDEDGNEVDYIYISSYEGCLYDVSESKYLVYDDNDYVENENEELVYTGGVYPADFTADKLSSIAGVKPASGQYNVFTRPNAEATANNRGNGWHIETTKISSMEQLLMAIEFGQLNLDTPLDKGIQSYAQGTGNEAANTGGTASLGEGSGNAASVTRVTSAGVVETKTGSGNVSVRYRGKENDFGNIWSSVYDMILYGNKNLGGGQPYICSDYNFSEFSAKADLDAATNYHAVNFTVANNANYISAIGYDPDYDWLFVASETKGSSSTPVGDYTYVTANLNGFRVAFRGGSWFNAAAAGAFYWALVNPVGYRSRTIGARAIYVPQYKRTPTT